VKFDIIVSFMPPKPGGGCVNPSQKFLNQLMAMANGAMTWRKHLPDFQARVNACNPEGIESISPGLAAPADYLGKMANDPTSLKGLNPNRGGMNRAGMIQPRWGWNGFGNTTQGGASAQPWAER
jgi:hypothetical protein